MRRKRKVAIIACVSFVILLLLVLLSLLAIDNEGTMLSEAPESPETVVTETGPVLTLDTDSAESSENPTSTATGEGDGDVGGPNPESVVPIGDDETGDYGEASLYTYYGYFGGTRRNNFFVVPEYPLGTLMALALCLTVLGVFKLKHARAYL